jgi:hypothetical protein
MTAIAMAGSGSAARRRRATMVIAATVAIGAVAQAVPASAATVTTTTFTLTSNSRGTATLPAATLGRQYSVQLDDGSPTGTDTYRGYGTWPVGISMSTDGLIHGTASLPQSTKVLVIASDDATRTDVRQEFLTLTVSSGNPTLDPTLIPLVSAVVNSTGTTLDEVQGEIALVEGIESCLADPQAPPTCLLGQGL